MANKIKETAKLLKTLHMVQQGFVRGEKYERLFDSHISMVAIHEASHAVIATMLGVKVAMVEIEMERVEFDNRGGIVSGAVVMEKGERERLLSNHQGRMIDAAILLASRLTRDFKFEWQIENYLVESGFSGDNMMLESLNDEVAVWQGGSILWWALDQQFVIDAVETVAEVLNEKKVMFGEELRELIFKFEPRPRRSEVFTQKKIEREKITDAKATILTEPETTQFMFLDMELQVCAFRIKEEANGRETVFGFVEATKEWFETQIASNRIFPIEG